MLNSNTQFYTTYVKNVILQFFSEKWEVFPPPVKFSKMQMEQFRFQRSNFNYDENGRKLFKQVENTVGKGEIACYKQFLLFP